MQLFYYNIFIICYICCSSLVVVVVDSSLFFPASSAYGIFAAVAVPLEIPHRNIFVSYNFEGNYNLPEIWGTKPIFTDHELDDNFYTSRKIVANGETSITSNNSTRKITTTSEEENNAETTESSLNPQKDVALITRQNIYHILSDKLKRGGFHGESCLLRLICEVSATELGDTNGVLGSLIHVLFSPSTSEAEELPLHYYQAEHDGWNDHCHYYENDCNESFLDLISKPFDMILNLIESNKL